MKTIATMLVVGALGLAGCQTAEPQPELMSDAEWSERLGELDKWREAKLEACDGDVECQRAVTREYLNRVDALFEERLARVEARWDARRR